MTIYIAGPMTGMKDYNFPAFHTAEAFWVKRGWRVLNPAKIGVLPEYALYWPINRAMLDGADAVYLMEGWRKSAGARKEKEYAEKQGLLLIYESMSEKEIWAEIARYRERVPVVIGVGRKR